MESKKPSGGRDAHAPPHGTAATPRHRDARGRAQGPHSGLPTSSDRPTFVSVRSVCAISGCGYTNIFFRTHSTCGRKGRCTNGQRVEFETRRAPRDPRARRPAPRRGPTTRKPKRSAPGASPLLVRKYPCNMPQLGPRADAALRRCRGTGASASPCWRTCRCLHGSRHTRRVSSAAPGVQRTDVGIAA